MPQVDTNGIKIEYRFDGKEGAPYITFVTGIANDLTMWDAQVAALGKDYRTLRYDLRGHGDTQATEGDYSMELLVRDLTGLLNELNIQKTAPGRARPRRRDRAALRHRELAPRQCARALLLQGKDGAGLRRDVAQAARGGRQRGGRGDRRADRAALVLRRMEGGESAGAAERAQHDPRHHDARLPRRHGGVPQPRHRSEAAADQGADALPFRRGRQDGRAASSSWPSSRRRCPAPSTARCPDAAHIANIQNPAGFNKEVGDFLRRQI